MANNDFRYIITTELKLAPGNLQNLINEIKQLDKQLMSRGNTVVGISARLTGNSIRAMQDQLNRANLHVNLNLRVSDQQIRQLQTRLSNAGIRINPTVGAGQGGTGSSTPPVHGTVNLSQQATQAITSAANAMRDAADSINRASSNSGTQRVGSRNQNRPLTAMEEQRLAVAERQRAQADYFNARTQELLARQHRNSPEGRAERRAEQDRVRAERVAERERESAKKRAAREAQSNLRREAQERQREIERQHSEQERIGRVRQRHTENPDLLLSDPRVNVATSRAAMQSMIQATKELAVAHGVTLTRSFQLAQYAADGTIAKARTLTYEFNRNGEVVEKTDGNIRKMLKNISMYTLISAGLYQVAQGFQLSVQSMAQFESEFIRISDLVDSRNNLGEASFNAEQSKKDILRLARLGFDPSTEVSPVYRSIVSRPDIAPDSESSSILTKQILQSSKVAYGDNPQSDEIKRLADDYVAIYTAFRPQWIKQGLNPLVQMSKLSDLNSAFRAEGSSIDKTLDSLGQLAADYATGPGGIRPEQLIAVSATSQKALGNEVSGQVLETRLKTLFANATNPSADSDGARLREMLGVKEGASFKEIYSAFANVFPTLSEAEQREAAAYASNRGSTQSETLKILKSVSQSESDLSRIEGQGYFGETDRIASKVSSTLTGEFLKLTSALKELSVVLGDSGILTGLKTLTTTLTYFVNSLSYVFQILNDGMNMLKGLDEEKDGGINDSIIAGMQNGLQLALVASLGRFVYRRFRNGGGSILDPTGIGMLGGLLETSSNASQGQTRRNRSGIDLSQLPMIGPFDGYRKTIRNRNDSRLYYTGTINNRNRLERLSSIPRAVATTERVTDGKASKLGATMEFVGSAFMNLIRGPLGTFGGMLLRLTVWGAALGGAFYLVSKIANTIESQQRKGASDLFKTLSSPDGLSTMESKLDRLNVLTGKVSSAGEDGKTFGDYVGGFLGLAYDKNRLDTGGGALNEEESLEMKSIMKYLNDNGMQWDFTGKKLTYSIPTGDGNKEGVFDPSNRDDIQSVKNVLSSLSTGKGIIAQEFDKANVSVIKYRDILAEVAKSTERITNLTRYENLASKYNEVKFVGATDSRAFINTQLDSTLKAINARSDEYDKLEKVRKQIIASSTDTKLRILTSTNALLAAEGGTDLKAKIDESFRSAKDNKAVEGFSALYEVDPLASAEEIAKKKLEREYANSLEIDELSSTKLKEAQDGISDLAESILDLNKSYKELQKASLVASSGIQVFDGAIKFANSQVQNGKSLVELAMGDQDKITASTRLLGLMGKEAGLYASQLNSVASTMESIRLNNPEQDFSLNSLYDPQGEMTAQQAAYKDLLEKSYDISQNIDSSTVAMHEQRNAVAELILESDKYRTYWESITERIEMSKTVAKELRDLNTANIVNPQMVDLRSKIFGQAFDAQGATKENAAQARDNYLSIYQKASESLTTYGEDADKLKEALAEINNTLSAKIDAAFVSPLKSLIAGDITKSVNSQLEAGLKIKEGAESLGKVLDDFAKRYNIDEKYQLSSGTGTGGNAPKFAENIENIISKASNETGVPVNLIKAMITQESSGNPNATSKAGAGGLMQLMPATAKELGVTDVYDPEQNIMGGTKYFAQQLKKFGGSVQKALIAYNAGAGNVNNVLNSKDGEWLEPKDYVNKILGYEAKYSSGSMTLPVFNTSPAKSSNTQGSDAPAAPTAAPTANTASTETEAEKAKKELEKAQKELVNVLNTSFRNALESQVKYLLASNIDYTLQNSIRESAIQSSLSRVSSDYTIGYYNSINTARQSVANSMYENGQSLVGYQSMLAEKEALLPEKDGQEKEILQNEITALTELITKLQENTTALETLEKQYTEMAYYDPRYNSTSASGLIENRIAEVSWLKENGLTGGVEYYKVLQDINGMKSNYMDRDKSNQILQEFFDNFGGEYDRLAIGKQIKYRDDVNLLWNQMQAVSDAMTSLVQGTNDWHVILEDAVKLQEKVVELENQKAETAKRYFELTGKGIGSYINARAYEQSRDFSQNSSNLKTAITNYNQSPVKSNYTDELVNLQIIGELQNSLVDSVNQYRTALVDAFKAGALTLDQYMSKLNDLRDIQRENKEAAIAMAEAIQQSMQSSLADALKSGMEGNADAGLDFIKNVKSSIASTISSQISTTMLTQSGLMDKVQTMIQGITVAMTSGGTIDFTGMKQLMFDATNQLLPFIEQISSATQGMFGIMKDEVFNAPSGFKIDSYLYDISKAKTYADLAPYLPDRGAVNEVGAPTTTPNKSGSQVVTLPEMTNKPTGIGQLAQRTIPIEQVGKGSFSTPLTVKNPVKDILQGIMSLQYQYDPTKSIADPANAMLHAKANELRAALAELAPDVAAEIGSGTTGKSLEEIRDYMNENVGLLSEFDISMDSVGNAVGKVDSSILGSYLKYDSMILGINGVISAVNNIKLNPTVVTPVNQYNSTSPTPGIPSAPSTGSSSGGVYQSFPWQTSTSSSGSTSSATSPIMDASAYAQTDAARAAEAAAAEYRRQNGMFHTGGIAGVMNFMSGHKLKSNEISAILQNDETIFQRGQLGSFIEGIFGGASSGGGSLNINLTISGDATGMDKESILGAVSEGVNQAVREMGRQMRLNNLQVRGVSY